jgi:hypothetical protein
MVWALSDTRAYLQQAGQASTWHRLPCNSQNGWHKQRASSCQGQCHSFFALTVFLLFSSNWISLTPSDPQGVLNLSEFCHARQSAVTKPVHACCEILLVLERVEVILTLFFTQNCSCTCLYSAQSTDTFVFCHIHAKVYLLALIFIHALQYDGTVLVLWSK